MLALCRRHVPVDVRLNGLRCLPGWLRLVRAYTVLGRSDDAKEALARAKKQFAGNEQAIEKLDTLAADLGLTS